MKKAFIILLCVLAVFAIVSCKNEPKPEPTPEPEPKPAVTTFDVTFDSQGGSAVAKATVEKDAKVAKPEDPSKKDSYFYTWYTEAEFTNEYDFDTPVTQSITLYAKWIPVPATEPQVYKMTAGRESDRFQFQWIFDTAIKAGDVISFKYKTNRTIELMTNREMSKADTAIEKLCSDAAVSAVLGEDGWYAFSYTVPEKDVKDAALSADAKGIGIGLLLKDGNSVIGTDYIYIKEITYTTATGTTELAFEDGNRYSGAKGPIEKEYAYRLEATDGTDGVDSEKYDRDKFRLKFTGSPTVNEGDVFSITYKVVRTDEMTADRVINKFNIRDKGKWIYEQDSTAWTTFVTDEATGWTTATYTFASTYYDGSAVTFPATFYVDLIDSKMASPKEGRIPDVLYIKSITLTSGEVTTNLTLDEEATSAGYVCPIIKKY